MAAGGSTKVVLIALGGNAMIAVCKLGAAAFTGSAAMFAEGVHSIVDTGNQALLLYGINRSSRPADARHPFGYGMEVYFWSFVVAILLFSIGAGVSIVEGIEKIQHPHAVESPYINFIVIGLALVFEGYAFFAAIRQMNVQRGRDSIFQYIRRSKDAPLVVVLLEDTGALLGLMIAGSALIGVLVLDIPELDGIASVVIGLLLAIAAVVLFIETKGLLIGEAASPSVQAGIRTILRENPHVIAINEVLTMHMGPQDVFCALSVDFCNNSSSADVERAISDLERRIQAAYPEIRRIFIEAQSVLDHARAAAQIASQSKEPHP
jgi:cation diffusion facilitator family transporter